MTVVPIGTSLDAKIKSACDIMRRSNVTGALQYIPELTWILFLRILDEREELEERNTKIVGNEFQPSIECPYRWRDWAAPDGEKRIQLQNGVFGDVFEFVNRELLPHLKNLGSRQSASNRQVVIGEIMSSVEASSVDTERNFLDVVDKVHEIRESDVDVTHVYPISRAYEALLPKLGEKQNDGGQHFTPREVIKAIVNVVDPKLGEAVLDPACGTGGFLVQAYEHIYEYISDVGTGQDLTHLSENTFFGKEKDNLIYPLCLANLILHGIDNPNIWHGNTLTGTEIGNALYRNAPANFDVVLMNPPFGGEESIEASQRFAYKTISTQVLFLQEVIDNLTHGGRAGIVVDEGLLFRTNENAFVQTKRKLLDECDVYCVVSLPQNVFVNAGANNKTNLMFFNKGQPTVRTWYYDLSAVKVTKRRPLTLQHFEEFFRLLPTRADSENSWTVKREVFEENNYDLKAMNPNRQAVVDTRTSEELLDIIEAKGEEIRGLLAELRGM